MSSHFEVRSVSHIYEVRLEDNFALALQKSLLPGDIILIDTNIRNLYKKHIDTFLENHKHIIINPSEEEKNFPQLGNIISYLIENGFKKNHRLVAIGGGITQDITGFIASIMYRGVDWIFFPTTLLAQGDSCIGSKTSINFNNYKNQLGTFYPPIKIIIDTNFLDTLSDQDIRSGMGEMIHYYLVAGESDFNRIKAEYMPALKDKSILNGLILRSLEIKKSYIERDEFDKKERRIFNYGHSFGHVIESLSNYRIPHGVAVSFGMDIANFISVKLGYISENLRLDIRELLSMNWGETKIGSVNVDEFYSLLSKDKKNKNTDIRVILTKGLGQMFFETLPEENKVKKLLKEYFQGEKP